MTSLEGLSVRQTISDHIGHGHPGKRARSSGRHLCRRDYQAGCKALGRVIAILTALIRLDYADSRDGDDVFALRRVS